jgi:hypothetical protein
MKVKEETKAASAAIALLASACGMPVGAEPGEAEYPASCRELRAQDPGATDGDYQLFVDGDPTRPWDVYCHDMADGAREFVTLPTAGPDSNASRLQVFDEHGYSSVVTLYSRVRIDPQTLEIDIGDLTFSRSAGTATPEDQVVTSMSFGVAAACSVDPDVSMYASSSIDLDGTPFAIASTFCIRDARPEDSVTWLSETRTRAELDVVSIDAGRCAMASMAPCLTSAFEPGHGYLLRLEYAR